MVDINKECGPCEENPCCIRKGSSLRMLASNIATKAQCDSIDGIWDKEKNQCSIPVVTDKATYPSIGSDMKITISLKLGLSTLFPGFSCDELGPAYRLIDLRKLDTLNNYYIRIMPVDEKGTLPSCAKKGVEGWINKQEGKSFKPEWIKGELKFPIDVSLVDIHNNYLSPLIKSTTAWTDAQTPEEKTTTFQTFDPSCLLNEQWIRDNTNVDANTQEDIFVSYIIQTLYFNNLERGIPVVVRDLLEADKSIINDNRNRFRIPRKDKDGKLMLVQPKDLIQLLETNQDDLDQFQFAFDEVINRLDSKTYNIVNDSDEVLGASNQKYIRHGIYNYLTLDGSSPVDNNRRIQLQDHRNAVLELRNLLDRINSYLWSENPPAQINSEAGKTNWNRFRSVRDCLNIPTKVSNQGQSGYNNRNIIKNLLIGDNYYDLGSMCPTESGHELCEFLKCLGFSGEGEISCDASTKLRAKLVDKSTGKARVMPPPYDKVPVTIKYRTTSSNSQITGINIMVIVGEDACTADGEIPIRKRNYAVLKRPLEYDFTNGDNCDFGSTFFENFRQNCCTDYKDDNELNESISLTAEDFDQVSPLKPLKTIREEDGKLVGYVIYQCKECKDLKLEISRFSDGFSEMGYCCSEGAWEEITNAFGDEIWKLKKPITAGLTDISKCCRVAQNNFNKSSHFVFQNFPAMFPDTDGTKDDIVIVDKPPTQNPRQLILTNLDNECLNSVKCCVTKRDDGGACFYKQPIDQNRKLKFNINFKVTTATLPETHQSDCTSTDQKLGHIKNKKSGLFQSIPLFDKEQYAKYSANKDITGLPPSIILHLLGMAPSSSKIAINHPDGLLLHKSKDGDQLEYTTYLPNKTPFIELRSNIQKLQAAVSKDDDQFTDANASTLFGEIIYKLWKENRLVFAEKKNILGIPGSEVQDEFEKSMRKLGTEYQKIASLFLNCTGSGIYCGSTGDLKKIASLIFVKRLATENYEDSEIYEWIEYMLNDASEPYEAPYSRAICIDKLIINEPEIAKYDNHLNYCNLSFVSGKTDEELVLEYLNGLHTDGTPNLKRHIGFALNAFESNKKISFNPGYCGATKPSDPAELYGCIGSNGTGCCDIGTTDVTPSFGTYICLQKEKATLDSPPHPVGTKTSNNNPYNDSYVDGLKAALIEDMWNDWVANGQDGIYQIKINVSSPDPCVYNIQGTFYNSAGQKIDSEEKCKNHAESQLECCNIGRLLEGGTCTEVGQSFKDYVYIPGLNSIAQADIRFESKSIKLYMREGTGSIDGVSVSVPIFTIVAADEQILTEFGNQDINIVLQTSYGKLKDKKFGKKIKASELKKELDAGKPSGSKNQKSILDLIGFPKQNSFNDIYAPPELGSTWTLYINDPEIQVQNYPNSGCIEIDPVRYDSYGSDKTEWVPAEFICLDNTPFPPAAGGESSEHRLPGTKYYKGSVVSDCSSCTDTNTDDPPTQPQTPISGGDSNSVSQPCVELRNNRDTIAEELVPVLGQLQDRLNTYNSSVNDYNSQCVGTTPSKNCSRIIERIKNNYINAKNKNVSNLLKDLTKNIESRVVLNENTLPDKIGVSEPTAKNQELLKKYIELRKKLDDAQTQLDACIASNR